MRSKYQLACYAIVFIVLLRIGIGWHYLYEGIHKFDPAAGFSAEGFLGVAKGPTAGLYYWMLPDLDGTLRIKIETVKDENDKDRKTFIVYENAWKEYFADYLVKHSSLIKSKEDADAFIGLGTAPFAEWVEANVPTPNEDKTKSYEGVDVVEAKTIFNRYLNSLRDGATDTEKDVEAFLASRERYLTMKKTLPNSTDFEQERRWNAMMKYRTEAAGWTKMLEDMGNGMQSDLGRLADAELAGQKDEIVTAPMKALIPPNPLGIELPIPSDIEIPVMEQPVRNRMNVLDLAVMYGLSALGLCMVIGFCTRLACLGAAVFLVNVILTTLPVPGIYPEIPSMVGNFLFVSKDVVELLAVLFLASIPSGRWGGLDYFLWNFGGKQICGLCCPRMRAKERESEIG